MNSCIPARIPTLRIPTEPILTIDIIHESVITATPEIISSHNLLKVKEEVSCKQHHYKRWVDKMEKSIPERNPADVARLSCFPTGNCEFTFEPEPEPERINRTCDIFSNCQVRKKSCSKKKGILTNKRPGTCYQAKYHVQSPLPYAPDILPTPFMLDDGSLKSVLPIGQYRALKPPVDFSKTTKKLYIETTERSPTSHVADVMDEQSKIKTVYCFTDGGMEQPEKTKNPNEKTIEKVIKCSKKCVKFHDLLDISDKLSDDELNMEKKKTVKKSWCKCRNANN